MSLFKPLKPAPVRTKDKEIQKFGDDVIRAFNQLHLLLNNTENKDALTIKGDVHCDSLYVKNNSLYIGGIKMSKPNLSQDEKVMRVNISKGEYEYVGVTELISNHSSSHEDGGGDEISINGLAGTPAELTTHMGDTSTHGVNEVADFGELQQLSYFMAEF